MKYLIPILIVLLLLAGGLIWMQSRNAERARWELLESNRLHQQRVAQIRAQILAEKDSVKRLRNERAKTDSIFAASISAQKAKTAREQRKVTELRPQIDQLADSITVLAQFLEANDSLFHGKDVEIALLNQKLQADSVSHASEVKHLNNQIDTLQAANVANLGRVADLERSLNKAVKKANKRLSFGIGAGQSITQYDSKLVTGPSITGGIFYRIFYPRLNSKGV